MSDSESNEIVNKVIDKGNKGASELEKQKKDGRSKPRSQKQIDATKKLVALRREQRQKNKDAKEAEAGEARSRDGGAADQGRGSEGEGGTDQGGHRQDRRSESGFTVAGTSSGSGAGTPEGPSERGV